MCLHWVGQRDPHWVPTSHLNAFMVLPLAFGVFLCTPALSVKNWIKDGNNKYKNYLISHSQIIPVYFRLFSDTANDSVIYPSQNQFKLKFGMMRWLSTVWLMLLFMSDSLDYSNVGDTAPSCAILRHYGNIANEKLIMFPIRKGTGIEGSHLSFLNQLWMLIEFGLLFLYRMS